MNNKVMFGAGFILGGIAGVISTFTYAKNKYFAMAQVDIDEMRNFYLVENSKKLDVSYDHCEDKDAVFQSKYSSLCREYTPKQMTDSSESKCSTAYIISPEEYGNNDDYNSITLLYHSDDILTDCSKEIIDNYEDIIGDALDHFDEYEDDAVYVRNDEKRYDYEILRVNEPYE